jgi:glucosamine-6-phosphate isomerase
MTILHFQDHLSASQFMAREIADAIRQQPQLNLCMASGDTPALTCQWLVKELKEQQIDYSQLRFFGLDEWVGLSPDVDGSCALSFKRWMIEPLALRPEQIFLFNALAADLQAECKKMDDAIEASGGLHLMLVGIGMNGHIGFNEPGTPFSSYCHVAQLAEMTVSVGEKYFNQRAVPTQGITIGLRHLMNTQRVYVMANGTKKASVIQQAAEGPLTNLFPASIIQQHTSSFLVVDAEAASMLDKIKQSL